MNNYGCYLRFLSISLAFLTLTVVNFREIIKQYLQQQLGLILQLLNHLKVLWTHSYYKIPVWGDFWQFIPKVLPKYPNCRNGLEQKPFQ